MTTWRFKEGYAIPAGSGDAVVMKRRVDIPDLIAHPGKLTDTSGVDASLASTGFGAADILQVFLVPQGFLLYTVGVFMDTVEDSTCTGDIGIITSTQNNWASGVATNLMNTWNLETAGAQMQLVGDTLGGTTYMSTLFITNGIINVTFNNAADTAIFDIWAVGWYVRTYKAGW